MNLEERYMTQKAMEMRPGYLNVPPTMKAREQETRTQAMTEQFVSAADAAAGAIKGGVAGSAGILGDTLAIGRGLFEIGRRGGDESAADAFLKGLEAGTIVPTTDRINKWLEDTLGPVVPEGQQSGVPTEMREKAAERGQMVGEVLAPGGVVAGAVKATKAVGRAAKKAVKGAKNGD